jgi:hypothetical protein
MEAKMCAMWLLQLFAMKLWLPAFLSEQMQVEDSGKPKAFGYKSKSQTN